LKKIFLALFITLLFISCASQNSWDKEHQSFLLLVEQKKKILTPNEYRFFLNNQILTKEGQIASLVSEEQMLSTQLSHNEIMDRGKSDVDVHMFEANSNKHRLYRVQKSQEMLERELLFLRSQLSSLEK